MDAATFEELLRMVAPLITYQDTTMREAILPAERLAVTQRFLATGELYTFSMHTIPIMHDDDDEYSALYW